MFELALKARLPIVAVETTDVLNYVDVIRHTLNIVAHGSAVKEIEGVSNLDWGAEFNIWYSPGSISVKKIYESMLEDSRVLILVNVEKTHPLMYNAGRLPTPKQLIKNELLSAGFELRQINQLLPALSGLDLLQVGEICRLAMAEYGELTAQAITSIKMMVTNQTGLMGVDVKQDFYLPKKDLASYVEEEGGFFIHCEDERLVPRGLLLHGMPGTGKSQAAKYIARHWKVPLYFMDLSSIMGKYVGQSENNMREMLVQIDSEEPCVLILDEVEKLFDSEGDSGTTTRLLGMLLWWLQEHKSRVFTVMTSNDIEALPEELYRPGRIDKVMKFTGLKHSFGGEDYVFAGQYANKFDVAIELSKAFKHLVVPSNGVVSHASVVEAVKLEVKRKMLKAGDLKCEK